MFRIRNNTLIMFAVCCIIAMTLHAQNTKGVDAEIKVKFELKYKDWENYFNSQQFHLSSDSSGVDTKYFSELVDLGTPALSFIMEKMEKDTKIFSVFRRITKKWFSKVEISDVQYDYYKLYKTWWDGGYKKTPELLEEYYPKWQDAIREGKAEEAETLFRKIRDLGIIIMPALFEKIKMGDYSSLPILEHLTEKKISADEVNKISDKVKKKEYCLDWWNKNKSTYLINFQ